MGNENLQDAGRLQHRLLLPEQQPQQGGRRRWTTGTAAAAPAAASVGLVDAADSDPAGKDVNLSLLVLCCLSLLTTHEMLWFISTLQNNLA